jgi:uncharacterized protein YuzE
VKFHYYPETDSLYIDLTETASVDSREVAPGVVLDFGADGRLVGIDVDQASKFVNLSHVEAVALPVASFTLLAGSRLRPQQLASVGLAVRETGEEYEAPSGEKSATS